MPDSSPFVQVFGLDGDKSTRAAQRFFKERRIRVFFVDLRHHSLAPAELRRFVERLGATALIDPGRRPYKEAGLAYLRMDDAEIVEQIAANPGLLRLPLVRFDAEVAAGRDGRPGSGGSCAAAPERQRRQDAARNHERQPGAAQNGSPTMKLEPCRTPVPWPIHTAPTRRGSR